MATCSSDRKVSPANETKFQIEELGQENKLNLSTLISNLPGIIYRRRHDRNWTIEFASEGCYQITGYYPYELIDRQKVVFSQLIHAGEREFIEKEVEAALQAHRSFSVNYHILTASQEEKWVCDRGHGIFSADGELVAIEGLITDITDFKCAEEELQLLQIITTAITQASDFYSALQIAITKVCEATGWDFGEAWIPSADGSVLRATPVWYGSTSILKEFRQRSQKFSFSPGCGLPGKVWLSQQPEWIPDVSQVKNTSFHRNHLAKECGLKAGFSVPILGTGKEYITKSGKSTQNSKSEVLAVLAFFMFESRQKDKRLVELVSAVAAQLGTFLQQKQTEAALRESERRLSTLIDSLPGIVFSCANDPEWSLIYLSEGCWQLTGYQSEELIGNRAVSYDSITHPEDLAKIKLAIQTGLAQKQFYVVEYRIRTKLGEEKWVWEKGNGVFDEFGNLKGIEGFITDITESKRAEDALRQAEVKYRTMFENAIEGIFQTTASGKYISANPALARLYGYSSPEELISSLTDIEHQLYVEPNRRTEFIHLLQENDIVSDFQSQVYRQDGSIIWIAENARAVRDTDGALLYYEGTVENITELKQTREKLRTQAFYDALTGLPNRALFMDRLSQSIERAKRNKDYLFAVLFLDLDGFKLVNDSLGHLAGDQLLIAISQRLTLCLRSVDTVARLGGDEFTILLEDIEDITNATIVAERIQRELQVAFNLEGHEVFAGTSIGIVLNGTKSIYNHIYERPEDLLRDADTALYSAKTLGKGRYQVFDIKMHQTALALLELEADLRHAVEKKEFKIYYQPIVCLNTGTITGFEALLRWQHPERGLLAPAEFISVAEETGLIIPLGWWIIRQSCNQIVYWQKLFPERKLTININLSSKQFCQPKLTSQIGKILEETGISGQSLHLEVSESNLVENVDSVIEMLEGLKEQQIQVCIDDFGTGYSSLGLIHRFPIQKLKIDRSFISGKWDAKEANSQILAINARESEQKIKNYQFQIIKTITVLAHNLGIEAIAEGVETAEQVAQLRKLNCKYAQGYFFSPPVDDETATELLSASFALSG